ncbi:MAG: hypothetical protein IKK93_11725 [Campylobacter sp.]|nr:hypothetical protein [Campylobacter sp.]
MFRFKTGNKILSMVDLSLKYPKVYQNVPLGFLTIYRDEELTIEEWLNLIAAFSLLDINEKIKMSGEVYAKRRMENA